MQPILYIIILCIPTYTHVVGSEEGSVTASKYNTCEECTCTNSTWHCSIQTCPNIDCPTNEQL